MTCSWMFMWFSSSSGFNPPCISRTSSHRTFRNRYHDVEMEGCHARLCTHPHHTAHANVRNACGNAPSRACDYKLLRKAQRNPIPFSWGWFGATSPIPRRHNHMGKRDDNCANLRPLRSTKRNPCRVLYDLDHRVENHRDANEQLSSRPKWNATPRRTEGRLRQRMH